MSMSESRRKKLSMLISSIARKDFDAAKKLISPDALRAAGGPGPAPAREGGTPAGDGATTDNVTDASEVAAGDGAALGPSAILPTPIAGGESPSQGPLALELACPGTELAIVTPSGPAKCWLVRRSLAQIAPDCLSIATQYAAVMNGARQRVDELEASAALCAVTASGPCDLLFLDIETCGLAGTGVFLVGTMFYHDCGLVFEQHLARDYAEEAAIVQAISERLDGAGVLVTFNGKSFDMNFLAERAAYHGVEMPPRAPHHLDLLHESRRRWRKSLPNCRLQTLERCFCGRVRHGDIPGWAIPDAYHRFVAKGDARELRDILHHNLLDLLTMAELLCAVLTGAAPPTE